MQRPGHGSCYADQGSPGSRAIGSGDQDIAKPPRAFARRTALALPLAGLLGAGPAPGLRDAAAASGRLYGAAVQRASLTDPARAPAFAAECGILTPETALKWRDLRPAPDQFAFGDADAILDFAARHGQAVRGHTLVWHEGLPRWFGSVTTATAPTALAEHVRTVCARYAGRLHGWDVVNEPIDAAAAGGLRDTAWLRLLGPGYVAEAFRLARAADPAAVLALNEYGIEADGADAKRRALLALLRGLRNAGAPVQALGMQGHLQAGDRFATLPAFLADVRALGLRVLVTELDVTDAPLPADPVDARDAGVAATYAAFLRGVAEGGGAEVVLTWGLMDDQSWLQRHKPRADGQPKRPLPLDSEGRRKPAWFALRDALMRRA